MPIHILDPCDDPLLVLAEIHQQGVDEIHDYQGLDSTTHNGALGSHWGFVSHILHSVRSLWNDQTSIVVAIIRAAGWSEQHGCESGAVYIQLDAVVLTGSALTCNGWYIVSYGLGIYMLHLGIGFLSPASDPATEPVSGEST